MNWVESGRICSLRLKTRQSRQHLPSELAKSHRGVTLASGPLWQPPKSRLRHFASGEDASGSPTKRIAAD